MKQNVRTSVSLAVLVVSILSVSPCSGFFQSSDEAAIQTVIARFFTDFQKRDLAASMGQWHQQSPYLAANRDSLQKMFASADTIEVKKADITRTAIDSNKATLRVALELNAFDSKTTAKPNA